MPISIVVPVRNEDDNLETLIVRLDQAFTKARVVYEIVAVDDCSSDSSLSVLHRLKLRYPINIVTHTAVLGKAQSLLDGFAVAHFDLVGMIDADLQYQPSDLIPLYDLVNTAQTDLAVGTRCGRAGLGRTLGRHLFHRLFVRALHHLPVDAQSGLKVFRREILARVTPRPGAWSFDLELLVKARMAGYSLAAIDVSFGQRARGPSKRAGLPGALALGLHALKLKLFPRRLYPFNDRQNRAKGKGFHYLGHEFIHHTSLSHGRSAFHQLTSRQKLWLLCLLCFFVGGLILGWRPTLIISVALLTGLYFADLLFNLYLIYRSFAHPTEIDISESLVRSVADASWPTYTILCPLYREAAVIPQFVHAMESLDYPRDRLQVLLLLEANDSTSRAAAAKLTLPPFVELVLVPPSLPKTKPKACNYGLSLAKGAYCTIYDAEDIPDPLQLKQAVVAFSQTAPEVICIQAKLNFYNPTQNLLTRIFTAEYSLWFDLVLTGLHSLGAPIPLGGTSNHFRTSDLRRLRGWDAFNVTEDCDLGMRLAKQGYRTAVINSVTYEEANSNLQNWLGQRTRWIKGYIQTYLVHVRRTGDSWRSGHYLAFQLVVGGKVLSMFINPLMWLITGLYFAARASLGPWIEPFFPGPVLYMAVFSLVFGNFLYMYYYMIGCAKRGQDELIKYVIFVPLYWLGMSVAAWCALGEVLRRPHHWSKTRHGLHLSPKQAPQNRAFPRAAHPNPVLLAYPVEASA